MANAIRLKTWRFGPDFYYQTRHHFMRLFKHGWPDMAGQTNQVEHDIAPSMVARKLLECYLMKLHDNNLEDSWPKFIIDKLKQNTYSSQPSRTAMSIIYELAALNQTTVSIEESVSGGKHCITIQIEGHSFNGYGQSWSEGLTTASTLALSNLPPDWIVRTELQSIIEKILNPIAAGHTAEPINNNTSTIKSVNKVLSKMSNNPHLIPDPVLAQQTLLAHAADVGYGPIQMALRKQIGEEYELKLARELKLRDIPFKTEDDLRRCGYDKTPDIKLEAPIGVSGKVVSWIDSKAMFADSAMHKKYLDEQLWSYWNRFGPGLVIYWFGHVAELEDNSDKGILVLDDFPQDIVKMDSL